MYVYSGDMILWFKMNGLIDKCCHSCVLRLRGRKQIVVYVVITLLLEVVFIKLYMGLSFEIIWFMIWVVGLA